MFLPDNISVSMNVDESFHQVRQNYCVSGYYDNPDYCNYSWVEIFFYETI